MSKAPSTNVETFRYRARSELGQLITGTMSAKSSDAVGITLAEQGLFVIDIESAGKKPADARPPAATKQQIAWQMSQLATMLESGMSLSESLDCLAKQAKHPSLRTLLEDVHRTVCEGQSLSDAMARFPKAFPSTMIAMTRASEMTGSLSTVLRKSSGYMLRDAQVLAKMRSALAYPIFMMSVCLIVVIFLLSFVLPTFARVFESQGEALPAPTQILMDLSRSITNVWELWLIGGIAAAIALFSWTHSPGGKRTIDTAFVSLPLLAPLYNTLHQARAFRTLAMLLTARAPLIDAITVAREIVPNTRYSSLFKDIEEQVKVGAKLASPLYEAPFIEDATAQMIDNGDRSGNLAKALDHLAEHMEQRFSKSIATTLQMIEPLMILTMGCVLGFVAIAMMLPLFRSAWVLAH